MSDKGRKSFLNKTNNKSQKMKKNSEENKENLIQNLNELEKKFKVLKQLKECDICGETFDSVPKFRNHIYKNNRKVACQKSREKKVIIHMSRGEVSLKLNLQIKVLFSRTDFLP